MIILVYLLFCLILIHLCYFFVREVIFVLLICDKWYDLDVVYGGMKVSLSVEDVQVMRRKDLKHHLTIRINLNLFYILIFNSFLYYFEINYLYSLQFSYILSGAGNI